MKNKSDVTVCKMVIIIVIVVIVTILVELPSASPVKLNLNYL